MTIFFNEKKGYIFEAQVRAKGIPVYVAVEPVDTLPSNVDISELAEKIKKTLNISRHHEEIDLKEAQKYQYWKEFGCKSYGAFSKAFNAVRLEENGDFLLTKYIRDNQGAHVLSAKGKDCIKLVGEIDFEKLATAAQSLLKADEKVDANELSGFRTLGGAKVSYNEPTEDLDNCGDGGTDAYQIYEEPDTKNLIAFLIDNGYKSFGKDDIRTVLERQFGAFDEFRYDDLAKDHILVSAHNSKCRIESNIYHKEDDLVEVLCYTEGKSTLIDESYSEIIKSLKIEWK